MEPRFIEPTTAGRLKLALLAAVGIAFSVAGDIWWQPFMDYVRALTTCESLPWLRGIIIGLFFVFWLTAYVTGRTALLILRSGQLPPPGAWVWSRTKVQTGWRAKLAGSLFAVLAAFFLAAPIVTGYVVQVNIIFCLPESCGC